MKKSQRKAIELRQCVEKSKSLSLKNTDTNHFLYFIDWNLLSFAKWDNFRSFFNLTTILKHKNTLNNARQNINKKFENDFSYATTNIDCGAIERSKSRGRRSRGIGHSLNPVKLVEALLMIKENENNGLEHLANVENQGND